MIRLRLLVALAAMLGTASVFSQDATQPPINEREILSSQKSDVSAVRSAAISADHSGDRHGNSQYRKWVARNDEDHCIDVTDRPFADELGE